MPHGLQTHVFTQGLVVVPGSSDVLPLLGVETRGQPSPIVSVQCSESLLRVTEIAAPHSGYIRILELNNPSTRNAISRALLAELRQEVHAIRNQYDPVTGEEVLRKDEGNRNGSRKRPTRALIVASALDSCFCAGADLKERKGLTVEETAEFLKSLRGTFTALSELPIPTISAISSLALGGGLELALATQFRVVSSNAAVALPETRLGIIPGAGGTYRLSGLIGISQARKMILTGRRVPGPEAYRLGIADYLVEVDVSDVWKRSNGEVESVKNESSTLAEVARLQVLGEAVRLAEEICQGAPVAIRAAIQALQDGPDENAEMLMYDRVMKTEDRLEALRAFGEKRSPVFEGR